MKQNEFLVKIDSIKRSIETKHKNEFVRLYKRIGNDIINLLQTNQSINFNDVLMNYQGDYIYLYRNIFQDVKKNLGYGIRKKLNFNLSLQTLLKSNTVQLDDQDKINNIFDAKYTQILNNETENLASQKFMQSEARYFENIYQNSTQDIEAFIQSQQKQQKDNNSELLLLLLIKSPNTKEKQRIRLLQKQQEALKLSIEKYTQKRQKQILDKYARNLSDKISTRAEMNTVYATGQASSVIREAEYESIKESGVSVQNTSNIIQTVALVSLIKKKWWHYSIKNPRMNHLALNGVESNNQGLFDVGGYLVAKPRDMILPAEESVNCRCEVEYVV
jgi:hypothetical protein